MRTLGIVGTGLIGGSLGIRARENGWRVVGYDLEHAAAEEAARCGALDEALAREAVLDRADVLAIAAHVAGTVRELERLRQSPPRKARLIVDVSSVKAPIVRASLGVSHFVATHPMAGRECSGPGAARGDLFEGRPWLYVPSGEPELDARAAAFISEFGATPVAVDADEHDRAVALTSHVPQLLATVFAGRLKGRNLEAYAGPAAREFLRLARSSSAMWHDIVDANREHIARELRAFAADLDACVPGSW